MPTPLTASSRSGRTGLYGLAVMLAVPLLVALAWWALGRPSALPPSPLAAGEKVACLSYAPYEGTQSPFQAGLVIPPDQIDRQFEALALSTGCLRTYSVGQGLDAAPALARKHGLKLLMGIWLGRNRADNAAEIKRAIELGQEFPDVIRAIVVGNEVLLRRDLPVEELSAAIAEVRENAGVPVTYADVWEFWERNVALSDGLDFVTVHILPYWEDDPVGVDHAKAHVADIRRHVGTLFPGKEILIGETGWPSAGRMREDALPSPANQARYLSDIIALSKENGWDYNLIEAKDQPWKRQLEGTVGGHWGVFDDALGLKFIWGQPLLDRPYWLWQGLLGVLAATGMLVIGRRALATEPLRLGFAAVVAGVALPWWLVEMPLVSLDTWDWAFAFATLGLTLILMAAVPLALARDLRWPRLSVVLGGDGSGPPGLLAAMLGWMLLATVLLLSAGLLAMLVDPRYRDFPIAAFALPMAAFLAVPAGVASTRPERVLAPLIAAVAIGIIVREGVQNWQALLFSAEGLLFALALRPWRGVRASTAPA
jgi:glucan 1,3-beta-glucosidase